MNKWLECIRIQYLWGKHKDYMGRLGPQLLYNFAVTSFQLLLYNFAVLCRTNGKHWFTQQELPPNKEGESLSPKSSWTESWLLMLTGLYIQLSNMESIRREPWRSCRPQPIYMELEVSNYYDVERKKKCWQELKENCTNYSISCNILPLTRFIAGLPFVERLPFVNDLME
jgi:hypothetical protein